MRTDKLEKEHGVQLKWTVFPLHPTVPDEGVEMSDLFAGFDLAAMHQRMSAVAAAEGLRIKPQSRIFNSRRAQELGKLADKLGLMVPFQKSVYEGYFVEGRNIALRNELVELAKRAGLPERQSLAALEERTFSQEVDDDWNRCKTLGITAVPAFVCDGKVMVGFKHYRDLVSLVESD